MSQCPRSRALRSCVALLAAAWPACASEVGDASPATSDAVLVTAANHEPCPPGIEGMGVAAAAARMKELGCGFDGARIQVVAVPTPVPKAGEALVRISASSVNPVDWKRLLTNSPQQTYPFGIGFDLAGIVESVGEGCDLAVGDEVWGMSYASYAQHVTLACKLLGRKPKPFSHLQAAVLPLAALTGLESLQWAGAPWKDRPTVLILGASGGTGSAGVQLAKAMGSVHVIATTSSANAAYVRSLGADEVIDYHVENWWEVFSPRWLDVIYDCACIAGTGEHAYVMLKDGGRFVTIQDAALASAATAASRPSVLQKSVFLDKLGRDQLDILKDMAEAGALNATIDSVFQLDEVPAAFNRSITAKTVGKIAIGVSPPQTSAELLV